MTQHRFLRAVEATSVLVFFVQAIRVVFSVLFGIIYDQVFAGSPTPWLAVSVVLVALVLLAPLAAPAEWRRSWLGAVACLAAAGRVGLSVNNADVRYWACLVVLASGALYLSGLLVARRTMAFPALCGALALDQLLRVVGQTYDVSLRPEALIPQIAWSVLVIGVSVAIARRSGAGDHRPNGLGGWAALGLGAALFLETSLLTLGNAVSRWSDSPYTFLAPLLMALTMAALVPRVRYELNRFLATSGWVRGVVIVVLPLGLMAGYFTKGVLSAGCLVLAQAAALASLACILDGRGKGKQVTGSALGIGLALLLLLNFLNAFAFTYPYAVPMMRGTGWGVYLLAALFVGVGVLAQKAVVPSWSDLSARIGLILPIGLAALALAVAAVWPRPADPLPETGSIRLATYNIHYGYDEAWHFTLEQIAQTIEANDIDVAALQEADTGRLTSYAVDDALYLARRLHMNVAYLPTVEHLTGIALLYRGPEVNSSQQLLTSLQEQTGIVHVPLTVNGRSLNVFGIWMGLSDEDTGRQIQEALAFIGDRSPASFGGDFNAEPGSLVAMAVQETGFADPFATLGIDPAPLTDPAVDPRSRIDFVWLRGLNPLQAWVPDSIASDHRMVVVEVTTAP